jgi:hypothetical protein
MIGAIPRVNDTTINAATGSQHIALHKSSKAFVSQIASYKYTPENTNRCSEQAMIYTRFAALPRRHCEARRPID